MSFKSLVILALLAISAPVQGAPYRLNAAQSEETAKQNSIAAQKLNVEFASMSSSDACQTGQIACIESAYAECDNSKWALTKCSVGSCFAVPESGKKGTAIVCETKEAATLRFTGVTGGIDGKSSNAVESAPVSSKVVSPTSSAPARPSQSQNTPTPEPEDPECEEEEEGDEGECETEEPEPAPTPTANSPKTITVVVTRTVAPSSQPTIARRQVVVPLDPAPAPAASSQESLPPVSPIALPSGVVFTTITQSASAAPTVVSPSSPVVSSPSAPIPTVVSTPVISAAPVTVTITQLATVTVTQLVQIVPVTPSVANSVPASVPASVSVPVVTEVVSAALPSQPIVTPSPTVQTIVPTGTDPSPVIVSVTITETSASSATPVAPPVVVTNPDPLSQVTEAPVITTPASLTSAPVVSFSSIDSERLKILLTATIEA